MINMSLEMTATIHKIAEKVIEVRNLGRSFGNLRAVDNLSLDVHRGEVFGFLGPNGAGKSTLIRMLVGLLLPSSGEARVLGLSMPGDADRLRAKVGYMTQKFSLYEDLSVEENLEFAAEIFGLDRWARKKRIAEVIDEYGLKERKNQRPAVLSGGWKQRLALAVATVHKPELLFLDEPTAGVDPDSRRLFWEKLFQLAGEGVTILVSTHYMDEAVRCHRLCMVKEGRLGALGTPYQLMESLNDRIVEIIAHPADRALKFLSQQEDVACATQMGNRLHLLLKPRVPNSDAAAEQLGGLLKGKNFRVKMAESAEPNLEDVFMALILGETIHATD